MKAVLTVHSLRTNRFLMLTVEEVLVSILDKSESLQGDSKLRCYQQTPGVIPMLLLGCEVYPYLADRLVDTAVKIGELTWSQPSDEIGLCHGLAGKAYAMHALYRAFNVEARTSKALSTHEGNRDAAEHKKEVNLYKKVAHLWRTRAFLLASQIKEKHLGVTEEFSLVEGVSGSICLLADLLTSESTVRFPGYEI